MPPVIRPGAAITAPAVAAMFVAMPGISLVKSRKSLPLNPISSKRTSFGPSAVGIVKIMPSFDGL